MMMNDQSEWPCNAAVHRLVLPPSSADQTERLTVWSIWTPCILSRARLFLPWNQRRRPKEFIYSNRARCAEEKKTTLIRRYLYSINCLNRTTHAHRTWSHRGLVRGIGTCRARHGKSKHLKSSEKNTKNCIHLQFLLSFWSSGSLSPTNYYIFIFVDYRVHSACETQSTSQSEMFVHLIGIIDPSVDRGRPKCHLLEISARMCSVDSHRCALILESNTKCSNIHVHLTWKEITRSRWSSRRMLMRKEQLAFGTACIPSDTYICTYLCSYAIDISLLNRW